MSDIEVFFFLEKVLIFQEYYIDVFADEMIAGTCLK